MFVNAPIAHVRIDRGTVTEEVYRSASVVQSLDV